MFAEFIEEKGVKPLAIAFGVPMPTIYSWKARNRIPRDRWDRLLELYPKLTYPKLRDMEIASRCAERA